MGAVRHVVMWQLAAPEDREATVAQMQSKLGALVGVVPGLRSLSVNPSLFPGDANWDVVLISEHDSAQALADYQVHPAHVEAASWVSQQVNARAAVDYELG
ncbi:A/B Barrel Domain Protein [Pontimonas salivibrio]|uniref:A/B Barrel Domain Protein n=1 Tax=Pontimonas salivibrio TaxID=1159327 RepID=A0A2L2BSQ0_9MICO|nr:Dabb family protein [Pontimonas salivibrio]AVG24688.1 A/B Barrel Domain Protein [Pontimonas salivibrio]